MRFQTGYSKNFQWEESLHLLLGIVCTKLALAHHVI